MSQFSIYVVLIILISLFGLVYTYRIAQNQRSGIDHEVSDKIEAHPYTLNPIFITYVVALILSSILIAVYMFRSM